MSIRNFKVDAFLSFCLIIISLSLRFLMSKNTLVLNNDAPCYIYMAQKFLERDWHHLNDCCSSLGYVYSIIVALFFVFLEDWEVSAKWTSIFLSSLAAWPLYGILRLKFAPVYAFCVTFVGLNSPYLIKQSVDVIRDPAFWFFLLLGIYFFVRNLYENSFKPHFFFFSSLSFFLAALNRVEALAFWCVSFFMGIYFYRKKFASFLLFCLFPLFVLLLLMCFLLLFNIIDFSVSQSFFDYIDQRFNFKVYGQRYQYFYQKFTTLWETTREWLWIYLRLSLPWLPILFLVIFIVKVSGFLFPFLLYGFWRYFKNCRQDKYFVYFLFLSVIASLVLLLWLFRYSAISKRYFLVFFFPALSFVALGIKESVDNMLRFLRFKKIVIIFGAAIYVSILMNTIFTPRRVDEKVYKDIASYLNYLEKDHANPLILSTYHPKIALYVNLYRKPAVCARRIVRPEAFFVHCQADYLILSKEEIRRQKFDLRENPIKKIKEIKDFVIYTCQK